VAVFDGERLEVAKAKGRLRVLSDMIRGGAAESRKAYKTPGP